MLTFQEIVHRLSHFWESEGCIIHQGYDLETGAGTFNPATFLRCLGPEPYHAAYIEPCRRPTDGRYGTNPNRLQRYFQYQVILKPSPHDIQEKYLKSLEAIGFNLSDHDIRFVHDDWDAPTLSAWGLGWEVWMDGMEVTQFTYFQSVGGVTLKPITGEITYGIERLAMYLQKVDSIYDLQWSEKLTYGDLYHRSEVEWSHYNFERATTEMWFRHFDDYEREAKLMMDHGFPIPAYDFVMKASHAFNLLDARGAISVTERTGYITRIRDLAREIAQSYLKSREELDFPLLKNAEEPIEPVAPSLPSALRAYSGDVSLLLEIGSEELPASFVPIGCHNLEKDIKTLLSKDNIPFTEIHVYGTPRRLAVIVEGIPLQKPEKTSERRGPSSDKAFDADGNLTVAGRGFFRSLGKEHLTKATLVDDPDIQLKIVNGHEYIFATVHTKSEPTGAILQKQLPQLILNLDFPKKMKWGNLDISYARPIKWIVAILGNEVIPFTIGNLISGHTTTGHRQLVPSEFTLNDPNQYVEALLEHKVMVNPADRKKSISDQLDVLKGTILCREEVIEQVVNMVEWPQVTSATFDEAFLKAPKEVLISEMVHHQKYFPIANNDGSLRNEFVITADNDPSDNIRKGNQKVLSARLSDGVFLYEQGLKTTLDELNNKLKTVTFQNKLGTVYDKVQRVIKHAHLLQRILAISSTEDVHRAAELCKADLASEMVYEFPELQGTIGKYYALAQNENKDVALAIEEHWMPIGEKAPLPETHTGVIISLADKIDNILGCFGVGLKPTSSSDPYALRRQALGMIRISLHHGFRYPVMDVFRQCLNHFPEGTLQDVLSEIEVFFVNRMKTVFLEYGIKKDETEAALSMGIEDLYDAFCKVKALHEFRQSQDFPLLFEVYKRARGQLNGFDVLELLPERLTENAEKQLNTTLEQQQQKVDEAITAHDYDHAYKHIAVVQPALATLFDEVKILADDPVIRDNRIALLQRVFALFSRLLDFSKLQES